MKYNKMKVDKIIKQGQKDAIEKLRLLSVSGNLRPILLLTSYCDDNSHCTNTNPCNECIEMCNIAFIEKDAIKLDNVVCGRNFIADYR